MSTLEPGDVVPRSALEPYMRVRVEIEAGVDEFGGIRVGGIRIGPGDLPGERFVLLSRPDPDAALVESVADTLRRMVPSLAADAVARDAVGQLREKGLIP